MRDVCKNEPQVGQHGGASGSILLDLDGFEVTAAEVIDHEWRLAVQTTATTVGCAACGTRARVHARRMVRVRDLPIGGRPLVLAWRSGYGAVSSRPVRCDLDRAGGRDPTAGGADRARPDRGLPASRQGRPRGRGGRP